MKGVFTAVVTPFAAGDQSVDIATFKKLIERQIEAKTQGIVIAGSTGEGQTLTEKEWALLVKTAVEFKNSIQVLASCGASSTQEVCNRVKEAKNLGAHGALVSTPPYNKPPQRGLIKHFEAIGKSCDLPLMVYNIPGRTAVNISPETMLELWKIPQVVALKESSGNIEQALQMLRQVPKGKTLLSGDDSMSLALWASGAEGIVSVLSNALPKGIQSLWNLWTEKKILEVQALQAELMAIIPTFFAESNPIPVKWAVGEILKSSSFSLRLPLVTLQESFHEPMRNALQKCRERNWL